MDDEHRALGLAQVLRVVAALLDHASEQRESLVLDDLGHGREAAEYDVRVEGEARGEVAGQVRSEAPALRERGLRRGRFCPRR